MTNIETQQVDAIVLAGGMNTIELFPGNEPGYKALLPFGGRPSIMYTLDALAACRRVQRVCIVGDEALLRPVIEAAGDTKEYTYLSGGESFFESIEHGLRYLMADDYVLVATADMPLVTSSAVSSFLSKCENVEEDNPYGHIICLSMVPRKAYTGPYEEFTKNFNPFRDGDVCHGNLMLIDPQVLNNEMAMGRVNALYNGRKNPIGTALAVGLRVGLAYGFGVQTLHLLSIERMAKLASWRFKLGIVPVLVNHPEITIDIDEAKDYDFVIKQFNEAAHR